MTMTQSISEVEKAVSVQETTNKIVKGWFVWLFGTIVLSSFAIFIIFSWTNIFRNALLSGLVLKNNSNVFIWWQRPPVRIIYKVRIFNYTNVDEFESGKAEKLRVEEVGPYVYREVLTRVNPVFHENKTISYQESRRYEYLGGSPENETVHVPNVPLFTVMAFSRDMPYLVQVGLTALLSTLQSKTFIKVSAAGYIWGYDDNIFEIAKNFDAMDEKIPFNKFGLLAFRKGLSKDRITMHTGSGDMSNLGIINRLNGKESRDVWGDKNCDKIYGTDGSMFPPHLLLDQNVTLPVYAKDMCRTIPLRFHGNSHAHGIPTLRYKPPDDVFTSSLTKDSCFCRNISNDSKEKTCAPAGIFNMSACNFDSPLMASFPHFYLGDKLLLSHVDGLNPERKLHESYVDLHPLLAVPVGGWSRLQVNLEARKAVGVPYLGRVKDGTILPLLWAEVGIDEFPDSILSILHHAFYTANFVEASFQWGSLVCIILSTWILLRKLKRKKLRRPKTLYRNTSGQNPLIE